MTVAENKNLKSEMSTAAVFFDGIMRLIKNAVAACLPTLIHCVKSSKHSFKDIMLHGIK